MQQKIKCAELDRFALDLQNPRLGRSVQHKNLSQDQVLEIMNNWSLEEIATSFLESGFWAHEAVLCIEEELDGENRLVVIEGNRRIAALLRLRRTSNGHEKSRKWLEMVNNQKAPEELFRQVPYILLDNRSEVDAFLGFRHVTGIKEWAPLEKAQFIAKLIEGNGLSYRNVMRRIGSKTETTVQRNYIAFSIFEQMEDLEKIDIEKVEAKFSVLFLSLRSGYVQDFLGIRKKFNVAPEEVKPPIEGDAIEKLREYVRWLFGDIENPPVVTDSRDVDKFASVLNSDEGLQYLRSVTRPSLGKALVIAGGDQKELFDLIMTAAYNVEESLSSIHHHAEDPQLLSTVKRLNANVKQLCKIFHIE